MFVNGVGGRNRLGGCVCERVKGDFSCSLHTGALIVNGLSGGDGSERRPVVLLFPIRQALLCKV